MKVEQLRDPQSPSVSLREVVGRGSKRFVRFGTAALLLASTLLSPIDAPVRPVKAESNPQQVNSLTLLHGDGSRDRLNIMLLPYNDTTDQMLKGVAADIFLIPPTDEFKDRVNVYKKNPEEDLKCDQNAICDWQAVRREIDRAVAMGVTPHETLTVIKSNEQFRGAGRGFLESSSTPPTIYTPSAVVRPEVIRKEAREFRAADITHELWGHAFAGFEHEGNDIMATWRVGSFFNPQHTQFLRDLMKLTPQNYGLPKNEIRIESIGIFSAGGGSESPEKGISAVVFTPSGTKQLYSEVRPVNGDGQSIIEHVKDLRLIHAWSETGKKIPFKTLSPATEYLWQVCSSGLLIPLPAEDPRWREVEGWPGKFFPNPCVEVKFETPDGMVRVYLPVVGKSANP